LCEEGHQEMMKIPVKISKNAYQFHIYQKYNGDLVSFVFSSKGFPNTLNIPTPTFAPDRCGPVANVWDVLFFANFSVCFLWVLIMPKWLIHDSGRIAICFGHVWNFQM
jgi:hypothetical protein